MELELGPNVPVSDVIIVLDIEVLPKVEGVGPLSGSVVDIKAELISLPLFVTVAYKRHGVLVQLGTSVEYGL